MAKKTKAMFHNVPPQKIETTEGQEIECNDLYHLNCSDWNSYIRALMNLETKCLAASQE